jgi:hypothetical protein
MVEQVKEPVFKTKLTQTAALLHQGFLISVGKTLTSEIVDKVILRRPEGSRL